MLSQRRQSLWLAFLTLLALALPVSGAEIDKYLPDDTEAVQVINIRQFLDSALIKKYALEKMQAALKGSDEVQKILDELGFDPFKDLDSYTQTNSGSPKIENSLYIVHGKFDTAKLHARAKKLAEDMPKLLEIGEEGGNKLYQVNVPIPLPPPLGSLYLAVVDDRTLVGSFSKDYILDVFDKKAGKKKTTLRKDVQELMEQVDGKQTFWLAGFRDAYLKGPLKDVPQFKPVVDFLEKVDRLSGGVTVTDEVKAKFTLVAVDAGAAKDVSDLIDKGLATAKEKGGDDPKGKAVLDALLKEIKVTTKEASVTLTARVSKEDIDKLVEMIK